MSRRDVLKGLSIALASAVAGLSVGCGKEGAGEPAETTEVAAPAAPAAAPTAEAEEAGAEAQPEARTYKCSVCGYKYDPAQGDPERDIAPGTPFEDLPEDWTCPRCTSAKDKFEPEEG